MIEIIHRDLKKKRRVKPKPGYVITLSQEPLRYWGSNGLTVPDISYAKFMFKKEKAEVALEALLRRFPNAEIVEVSITTDDEGNDVINGYPHKNTGRRAKIRFLVWDKYGGRCAYCGRFIPRQKFRMDQFYPSRGEDFDNLVPACSACAKLKKGLTPGQFQTTIETECRKVLRRVPEYRIAMMFGLVSEAPRVTFYYAKPEARIQLELSAKRAQQRDEDKDFVYRRGEYKKGSNGQNGQSS